MPGEAARTAQRSIGDAERAEGICGTLRPHSRAMTPSRITSCTTPACAPQGDLARPSTLSRRSLTPIKARPVHAVYPFPSPMKSNSRIMLGAFLATALLFSGCGKAPATASATARSEPAPAAASTATAKPASGRPIEVTANDTMKFNVTQIRAKPGEALAITLVNQGTMPKFSMGHNLVVLATDVDLNAFASDAAMAAKTDYVPASYKDRVVATTKLLGPKESDTVIFNAPAKPGCYPFVCSFPGHFQVGMKGELIVE
jgi:azurin